MKKISLTASISEKSMNYGQVRIARIDRVCEGCGITKIPQGVYGALYIPKKLGIPEEISIKIRMEEK